MICASLSTLPNLLLNFNKTKPEKRKGKKKRREKEEQAERRLP